MLLLSLQNYTEIVHPWPLIVLCVAFLAFIAYSFVSDR